MKVLSTRLASVLLVLGALGWVEGDQKAEVSHRLLRKDNSRQLGVGGTQFVSYFDCTYDVRNNVDVEEKGVDEVFEDIVNALVPAYNELMEDFDDPHNRRMTKARVYSSELDRRHLSSTHGRKLYRFSLIIQTFGFCNLCSDDFTFSDQISGRQRQLLDVPGFEFRRDPTRDAIRIRGVGGGRDPYDGSSFDGNSPDNGNSGDGGDSGDSTRTGAPTEAEILEAYSEYWADNGGANPPVRDILSLAEVEVGSRGKGKGKGGSKSKGSKSKGSKSKGGKGGSGSKSGKKGGKGKGGKGNSKGGSAKLSKKGSGSSSSKSSSGDSYRSSTGDSYRSSGGSRKLGATRQ